MGFRSAPARLPVARLVVVMLGLAAPGCEPLTQIVLVVDTDMNVPYDLDKLAITIEGTPPGRTFMIPANGFPLTLGMVPATKDTVTPVTVTIAATVLDAPVLTEKVHTEFVPDQSRMMRIVLSTACLPVTCDVSETCEAGVCQPIDRPGTSLPAWSGAAPARPPPPPPGDIVGQSVWASGWHSAAIQGTTLYAWGENNVGQLGTGNTTNAKVRRPVLKVQAPLSSVGLGQKHSCICDRFHQAFCWGANDNGQLGLGNLVQQTVATAVPGVVDCTQIAGADFHTCAIRQGGTVWCWGRNAFGQLGQPAGAVISVPQMVPGLIDVLEVAGGDGYTCVLQKDKTVSCWGNNNAGQLGDGTTVTRATPATVAGLTDVVEVAVGRVHACARQSAGTVWCWGSNERGQLGNGTQTASSVPVAVVGLIDAAQVVAGHQHSCALTSGSSTISCWGNNSSGQLGVGATPAFSNVPSVVPGLYKVTSMAAGSEYTCARHSGGTDLSCWGDNLVNQLGDGSATTRRTPVSVAGFSGP